MIFKYFKTMVLPLALLTVLHGDEIDLENYRRIGKPEARALVNLLANGDFEKGASGWHKVGQDGIAVEKGAGRSYSQALVYRRSDPGSYILPGTSFENLKPGMKYRFGVWVKAAGVTGTGASVCLEWVDRRTGKWVSGYYLKNLKGDTDWTLLEHSFVADANYRYSIACYLLKGSTGTASFDEAFLYEESGGSWHVGLIAPAFETVKAGGDTLELASFTAGGFEYEKKQPPVFAVLTELRNDAGVLWNSLLPVRNNRITLKTGAVAAGKAQLNLKLLDTANRCILAENSIPLKVAANPDSGTVTVDRLGRTLVGGKPFMPVGLYTGQMSPKEIRDIAAGGFNCVLSYNSMELKSEGKAGLEAIDAVLDCLAENQLKIVFSFCQVYPFEPYNPKWLKWNGYEGADQVVEATVKRWKKHPSILAWYICDELQTNRVNALIERRRLVNRLDPDHPTLSVLFQEENLQYYASGYDILGVDPYPIGNGSVKNQAEILRFMNTAQRILKNSHGGMPLWTVPQIFNVGNYRPNAVKNLKVYLEEFRYPTEHEIMSMSLLEAIFGSKGFIMYSHFDLLQGPDPRQYKDRWPQVCRVARTLRELEPFIMSDIPARPLEIKNIKGEVYGAVFDDGKGRQRVLVSAIGPGASEAEFTLPGEFASANGKTVSLGNGKYRFSGEDICSDILSRD